MQIGTPHHGLPRLKCSRPVMQSLDRLEWVAGLSFISFGVRIGIRTTASDLLEPLFPHLPPGSRPADSPVVDYLYSIHTDHQGGPSPEQLLYVMSGGPKTFVRTTDRQELLATLDSCLDAIVSFAAPRRLFVHAGVVAWRGRAMLIPGRSMSGKTRLVAAMVRAGATYYSDEFAVLDSRGRVHPYARPLSIRGEADQRPRKCPAGDLGGRTGTRPLPVGLVVWTRYQPGSRWRPRPLSPGEAVLSLLDNTVVARHRPTLALGILRHAVLGAAALQGERGEVDDLVTPLMEEMSAAAAVRPVQGEGFVPGPALTPGHAMQ